MLYSYLEIPLCFSILCGRFCCSARGIRVGIKAPSSATGQQSSWHVAVQLVRKSLSPELLPAGQGYHTFFF